MVNKEGIVAYIAGIIDGEGCITVTRREIKRLKTGNWYYEPQVIVSNTYKGLLGFCVEYYGGWIATLRGCKKGYKEIYHWKVTGDEMKVLIKDVLPYLIIKREQAKINLSFPNYMARGWGNKSPKGRSQKELEKQAELWIKIRKLNRGFPDDKEGGDGKDGGGRRETKRT